MLAIDALERHLPDAREWVRGVSPLKRKKRVFSWKGDFLCAYGVSGALYTQARRWLDRDAKRRLVFIEDRAEALAQLLEEEDAILLLNDKRVKLYFLESPLQIEPLAKKVAWEAVLLELAILDVGGGVDFSRFKAFLEECHTAASLTLSDAADGGVSILKHARANLSWPYRSALDLKGRFEGFPAIVVGAGPSLKKNERILAEFENRALILAGGHALGAMRAMPHIGAGIDREMDPQALSKEVPFCFECRLNPAALAAVEGERLLVPDSHFHFMNWIAGQDERFDSGWTVGNLLAALACHWGCNPIVFVGMDFCDSLGGVQRDWIMAARWMERLAEKHRDRLFVNATEGGVGFRLPIETKALDKIALPFLSDLRGEVQRAVRSLPMIERPLRWDEWRGSLERCAALCEQVLQGGVADFEGEIAYLKFLLPLWQIWRPIFERELDLDKAALSLDEKLRLNEALFYQQTIQDHLEVAYE